MEFWERVQQYVKPFMEEEFTEVKALVCLKSSTPEDYKTMQYWIGTISCDDPIYKMPQVTRDPNNVACVVPLRYLNELKGELIKECTALGSLDDFTFEVYSELRDVF